MAGQKRKTALSVRTEEWKLKIGETEYTVQVTFRQMRSIRLRVLPGGVIRLSAPFGTDREWLLHFLTDRSAWLAENTEKMKDRTTPEKPAPLTPAERRRALAYLEPLVDKWYPAVACQGIPRPRVTVRAMTTRFGSCSVNRGRITLSSVLLTVPKTCAEYVVLHELTHFLYPNHSRQFYEYISRYMPDWKERDRLLKMSDRR